MCFKLTRQKQQNECIMWTNVKLVRLNTLSCYLQPLLGSVSGMCTLVIKWSHTCCTYDLAPFQCFMCVSVMGQDSSIITWMGILSSVVGQHFCPHKSSVGVKSEEGVCNSSFCSHCVGGTQTTPRSISSGKWIKSVYKRYSCGVDSPSLPL